MSFIKEKSVPIPRPLRLSCPLVHQPCFGRVHTRFRHVFGTLTQDVGAILRGVLISISAHCGRMFVGRAPSARTPCGIAKTMTQPKIQCKPCVPFFRTPLCSLQCTACNAPAPPPPTPPTHPHVDDSLPPQYSKLVQASGSTDHPFIWSLWHPTTTTSTSRLCWTMCW